MKNLVLRMAVVLSVGALMAACSAKVDAPVFSAPKAVDLDTPTPADFQSKVTGPNLDGQWRSSCIVDYTAMNTWDVVTLKINGQAVIRDVVQYSDNTCATQVLSREEQGQYRFNEVHPGSLYDVEYRFKMPNGYYTQYESYRFDGVQLFISNEVGGATSADNLMFRYDPTTATP